MQNADIALAVVLRAGVAGVKGPQKCVVEDGKAGWIGEETSSVQRSRRTVLWAAGETPGHVLPGFMLASELLPEVERLLLRVAEH